MGVGSISEKSYIVTEGDLSFISKDSEKGELIEITTIDEFVLKNKITPGLIKMDLEGFEEEALKGAKKTIENVFKTGTT